MTWHVFDNPLANFASRVFCACARNMEDPFHQVRKQVVSMLATCERQQTKWGEARRRKPVRHDE